MARLISDKYETWKKECEDRFLQLKKNEEDVVEDIYDKEQGTEEE